VSNEPNLNFPLVIVIISYLHIHTYYSRFIPKGVAKASQTFLRNAQVLSHEKYCTRKFKQDIHILAECLSDEKYYRRDRGKAIAVRLLSTSGVSSFSPLVAFYETLRSNKCYSILLSRTPGGILLTLANFKI
jgi:hypothetical protein